MTYTEMTMFVLKIPTGYIRNQLKLCRNLELVKLIMQLHHSRLYYNTKPKQHCVLLVTFSALIINKSFVGGFVDFWSCMIFLSNHRISQVGSRIKHGCCNIFILFCYDGVS